MTYVEFFDKEASENICACLTHIPDRVIYIGENSKIIKKHIERYASVFRGRGYDIDFICKTVSATDLEAAVKLFEKIVETYDECVFDITGGNEILMLALGIVYGNHPGKNIQIHKFNLRNNTVCYFNQYGPKAYSNIPELSVEENIRIYGGDVVYTDTTGVKTYKWDITVDFIQDIDRIWTVCRKNVNIWNSFIGALAYAENVGAVLEDSLTTVVKKVALEPYFSHHKINFESSKHVLSELEKYGLIHYDAESGGGTVRIAYKNRQIKKCLTKSGQALEMKIFITSKLLTDSTGKPVYNDAVNGVVIDWDGKIHDDFAEHIYDTENEIDILLMNGVVPVFISCKNGHLSCKQKC